VRTGFASEHSPAAPKVRAQTLVVATGTGEHARSHALSQQFNNPKTKKEAIRHAQPLRAPG
jgi:hypothetical protein